MGLSRGRTSRRCIDYRYPVGRCFFWPSQSYRIFPAHPPPGLRPKLIPIQRKPMLDSSCMNMPIRISPDIVRQ